MIAPKLILYGFFYVAIFLVMSFTGGIGIQRPEMSAYFKEEVKEKITFNKDIKPIMNTYCGGVFCHHGKPSTWTNYAFTKTSVDSGVFYERVIEKRNMPKRKPLPEKEYQLIKKWLKNGAIEK